MENTTILQACQVLSGEGIPNLCALNFASAKNPGGGFLRGANAQEESICKASGLYICMKDSSMYALNQKDNNCCLYAHSGIYSPKVPIIKNDHGERIDQPLFVSFVTVPAVNAKMARKKNVDEATIELTMIERMDYVLKLMIFHGHRNIILGCYGCGVFGNSLEMVCRGFRSLLNKYSSDFDNVYFPCISPNDYATCRLFLGKRS